MGKPLKINLKLVNGEPVCYRDCASLKKRVLGLNFIVWVCCYDNIAKIDFNPCNPGLRQQRDELRQRTHEIQERADQEIGKLKKRLAEIEVILGCVAQ